MITNKRKATHIFSDKERSKQSPITIKFRSARSNLHRRQRGTKPTV
ncbi:MAG TPA: hypothetical protein VE868_12755 [Balneolaceae bacterium]|nr:hypothetical protein [Balneolaceae bacterium]